MQHAGTTQLVIEGRPAIEPVAGVVFAAQTARMTIGLGRFLLSVVRETAFRADPITIEPRSLQHC